MLQIGADIYCDSLCVIRELQNRFPDPTLYPGGGQGMPWAVARWTDDTLFMLALQIIFAAGADDMPPEFLKDRGAIYFSPGTDFSRLKEELPHVQAQLGAQLSYINDRVSQGRDFMLGAEPGLPDAACHYVVWFLNGRWDKGPEFLSQFPALMAWEKRMLDIGHGTEESMEGEDALEIAKAAEPMSVPPMGLPPICPQDPQELSVGTPVRINPLGYGTDSVVEGTVRWATRHVVSINREDPDVGRLAVHFPRVGYRLTKLR